MGKLRRIIGNNKLYIFLAVFILSIHLLSFFISKEAEREQTEEKQAEIQQEAEPEKERSMFDQEDVEAREQRLKEIATEDPLLYIFIGLLNLALIFLVLIGLILDGYFLKRAICKKPFDIRTVSIEQPRWGVPDILRVTLIFLSSGYLFVIMEAFFMEIFPILHNDNFRMVFNTAFMNIIGISVIWHFVVRKYKHDIQAVGLTVKRFANNVFYAVIGYMSLIPVMLLIMIITFFVVKWLSYEPPVQPIVEVFMEEKEAGVLWLSGLFAAVFGPLAEEIFFRGFMYPAVKRKIGAFGGILLTSALFSILHAHIVGFMPILALGVLLTYLYEKTGSLVSCITVHIFHNVAMLMMVFMVRGLGM